MYKLLSNKYIDKGISSFKSQMCIFICLFFISQTAIASFHKHLWPKWSVHNPLSQTVISHQEWEQFLNKRLITNEEGINLIDYPHLTKTDLNQIEQYINRLSHIQISDYNRQEQLAFWINLYNATIVRTIADYYPIDSVREVNISPGLFSVGPWEAHLINITGTQLTPNDIQNRIIRPIWNDPRTHYVLNDGTIGAPNLNKKPLEGKTIENQLNEAAAEYINSLRGLQLIEGQLIVSKIYNWYLEDFGGNETDVIRHLLHFAKPPLAKELVAENNIDSYIYNWHLNSTVDTDS